LSVVDVAREELDRSDWLAFLDAQRDVSIFHTPEMHRVWAAAPCHRPTLWVARLSSGAIGAMLPVVDVSVVDGPLRSWTTRTVAYGGVVCDTSSPEGSAALRALLARYRTMSAPAMFTELRHVVDVGAIAPDLRAAGFVHERHLNYLIHLDRPRAELWSALSRTARQRVRSAERKGVRVVDAANDAEVDAAYALLDAVYRSAHVPLAPRGLFDAAMQTLHPIGSLRVVVAMVDDQVIAARFLLCHRDRVLDWYAGSDRRYANYSGNELLVWNTLCWAQDQGYTLFDFGGAGKPDEPYGPREFKAKFGGDLVDHGRDVLVHRPARLAVTRTGYAVTRKVLWRRRRVPAR